MMCVDRGRKPRQSLEDVISLAAVKNSEFTRNPRRSNSLSHTLLQRRHWFHLMAIHDRQQATDTSSPSPAVKATGPKREADRKATRASSPSPETRSPSPFLTRKRKASDPDGGDPPGDPRKESTVVLVLEVDPASDRVVAKKRRRPAVIPATRPRSPGVAVPEGR